MMWSLKVVFLLATFFTVSLSVEIPVKPASITKRAQLPDLYEASISELQVSRTSLGGHTLKS